MPFMEEMVQVDSNWDEMLQQAPSVLAREVILTRPDSLSLKASHKASLFQRLFSPWMQKPVEAQFPHFRAINLWLTFSGMVDSLA